MICGKGWISRDQELKHLDKQREQNLEWYLSNQMLGGVCYVDRYGMNLAGIRAKIPYFQETWPDLSPPHVIVPGPETIVRRGLRGFKLPRH